MIKNSASYITKARETKLKNNEGQWNAEGPCVEEASIFQVRHSYMFSVYSY